MTDKVNAGDTGSIATAEAQALTANPKSDVEAKKAFTQELIGRGFESVRVTRQPADITASRNAETCYFEVKYTGRTDSYFGAATLTEWEAALLYEDRYWFVVASKRDGKWMFHEYTPTEFMEFSTIPPFKLILTWT